MHIKNKYPGLTTAEARRRLRKYGENSVYRKPKWRPVLAFIGKFNSPLLLILITVSVISLFLGQRANAAIILVMVLLSAVLDFINSYRSEKAVEKLNAKVVTTATVIRDGSAREVALKKIVLGDILQLSAGDIVPADCEILEARDFFINQAVLTGESYPIEKGESLQNPKDNSNDLGKRNLIFMSTNVVTGFCTARVVATGLNTEFGKIAKKLEQAQPETDFEKNIRQFSMFIMKITVVLVAFAFLTNALLGRGLLESFLFGIAIAIGLTPELLPMVISVSLSHGSVLMAKKDVVVKHLPAIQSFGGMDILCTDKTGTLTEDRIALVKHIDGFGQNSESVLLHSYLTCIFHTGVLTPLDTAIKNHKSLDIASYQKIDEIPFDFDRKRSSIIVKKRNQKMLICKGAPEDVLKVCRFYQKQGKVFKINERTRHAIFSRFLDLSNEGFRVLGVSFKDLAPGNRNFSKSAEMEMTFMGFVAFLDPPKESAAQAIADLERLGVEVKIITGDSDILTQKTCRDIRVPVKGVLTGSELSAMSDTQLHLRLANTTIFARVSPDQKERIILALKKSGAVVGYLGDGINDAPALAAADVGISVNNAVDVAKETADIILLRKSLRALRDGVIEGRKTFQNTMKYILMVLSSNFGNMFSMSLMPLFLNFLPMLPAQILFNNFLYDSSQVTLPTDTVDSEDIQKPPRWDMKFIRKYMLVFGPISSLFDFLIVGLLALVFHSPQAQFQAGWFVESLATQVFVIYVIRTKKVPFLQSRPSAWLMFSTLLAVCVGWLAPFSPMRKYLGFAPPSAMILISIIALVVVYLLLVEFAKRIFYRKEHSLRQIPSQPTVIN